MTNIIFEPHLDCICLTSNLFFRPVKMYREEIARISLRICVVEVNSVLPKVLDFNKLASY